MSDLELLREIISKLEAILARLENRATLIHDESGHVTISVSDDKELIEIMD